jgi:hypothetical protein
MMELVKKDGRWEQQSTVDGSRWGIMLVGSWTMTDCTTGPGLAA